MNGDIPIYQPPQPTNEVQPLLNDSTPQQPQVPIYQPSAQPNGLEYQPNLVNQPSAPVIPDPHIQQPSYLGPQQVPVVQYNQPPPGMTESYQQPLSYQVPPNQGGVVVQQPVTTIQPQQPPQITFYPSQMFCPHCNKLITTEVTYESGSLVFILCCVLCCFGLLCFSCIPCCLDGLKDAHHKCPICKRLLYVKSRF
ncbi:hypothetical protein CL6EHI_174170 [Entamoeba histolytica]|uniref:LITAF domain-containing protein n=1 Tax=Entamoeba histolytica TaxID=5759 RepID=A0A175JPI7_ENTHI|nr:hypothetical protein CL6EHI_174170 [Entamoeba histolytica]